MFGDSSGAIRAGAYRHGRTQARRAAHSARFHLYRRERTGDRAPAQAGGFYRANPRRPFGMAQVQNIFDRDVAGKADPALVNALADFELQFGDSVPSGTYLDMAVNMPMVDPARLDCPVLPGAARARRQRQRGRAFPLLPQPWRARTSSSSSCMA